MTRLTRYNLARAALLAWAVFALAIMAALVIRIGILKARLEAIELERMDDQTCSLTAVVCANEQ